MKAAHTRVHGSVTPKAPKEQRIERLSRHSARIVLELRREGDREGAARFEAVAIEAVELVRRGAL